MTQLILTSCGIEKGKIPTLIYEDNSACVIQMKEGYIKSDRTKHIPPRFFSYTQDLIKDNQIEMKYIQSSNNAADLFTKALPTALFRKHVHSIGMRHAHNIYSEANGGVVAKGIVGSGGKEMVSGVACLKGKEVLADGEVLASVVGRSWRCGRI
ncbi:hypothetical protein L6452_34253 [Arctium lappa]|uniref:Uncharacterized protein n=1 Tax=Arctium lappa TaxID=4217 RepID=A0ACB8YHP0_ARCLA|nr:hypothetical protein L6452_34253 [Arctium lappa]